MKTATRLLLAMIVLGILRGNPAPARSGLAFPVAQTNPIMILEPFVFVEQPVGLFHVGDERLFVVERKGRILIVQPDGIIQPEPFLDIQDRVNSAFYFDAGLLGVAFHPNYAQNGFFYLHYTDSTAGIVIARFQVSPENPNLADPDSELVILAVAPVPQHRGGMLAFGPDGYLYLALGDGENPGDPHENAQSLQSLLGKMLRIDVDGGQPYRIPADNPFVEVPHARGEIWAYGLRNPWRFSFDSVTGDLFMGDVGEFAWEEINFQPASSVGGENYGWPCYEGSHLREAEACTPEFVAPVHEYAQEPGCGVIGGIVYRGPYRPMLGQYFFTDFCTGVVQSLFPFGSAGWGLNIWEEVVGLPNGFGEDVHHNLYLMEYFSGGIYRIGFQSRVFFPVIFKP